MCIFYDVSTIIVLTILNHELSTIKTEILKYLQGIEHIKNEVEDLSEPLIDGIHGHGRYDI